MLQIQTQFVANTGTVCCKYRHSLLQIQAQFVALHPMLLSSLRVRHPIRFRPPPNQIPSAARSDSVRRPIRFRPPPVGGYGILPYPRSPHRGCSGLRCTNQAINQAATQSPNQPTKQSTTNQPSNQPSNQRTTQPPPFNFTHQKQPYIQQKH